MFIKRQPMKKTIKISFLVLLERLIPILINKILVSLLFISCNTPKTEKSIELIFDTSIGVYMLRDSFPCSRDSIYNILVNNLDIGEGIYLTNKDYSECVFLHKEPGGLWFQFSYLYLTENYKNITNSLHIDVDSFVTNMGGRLGLSEKEFLEYYNDVSGILKVKDSDMTIYLCEYDSIPYSAKYCFKNGKLCKLEFGYDW